MARKVVVRPEASSAGRDLNPPSPTMRERTVLRGVAQGYSNKEIAPPPCHQPQDGRDVSRSTDGQARPDKSRRNCALRAAPRLAGRELTKPVRCLYSPFASDGATRRLPDVDLNAGLRATINAVIPFHVTEAATSSVPIAMPVLR